MDGLDASVDFLVIWVWKSCQNWMLGCAGTIQKTHVFCDISIFQFVHDFGVSRRVLGPHFGWFGGTWDTILLILEGPGDALKFQ